MMDIAVGTSLDRIVIFAYFALVMGFGAYFGKYSKNTTDYFFGGRRFAWWLITISIVATGVGSHSFCEIFHEGLPVWTFVYHDLYE